MSDFEPPFEDLIIEWPNGTLEVDKLGEGEPVTTLTWGELAETHFYDPRQPRDEGGRWTDGGGSGHAKIGGSKVKVKGTFSPSAATKARLKVTPDVHELDPSEAGVFHKAMLDLKQGNKFASSVYVYDKEEYAQMRTFMTDDGKTGFAIKGDEVVSVFAARDTEYKGATASHLATAVEQGARRLDAYDTVLPKIYAEAGFEPVSRVKWNDDYAPDGWDYELYGKFNGGRPDVVAMVYNPAKVGSRYEGGGDYAADYDEMMSVAQSRAAGK